MQLNQLRALVTLAECGSIRGAARALGLSQSAVTRTLREMERELGATLLIRQTHGTDFTTAGQSLLSHARLVLATMQRAEEDVRRLTGQVQANVRMAITPVLAAFSLRRLVADFGARYPTGSLDMDIGFMLTTLPKLTEGHLDFAVILADSATLPSDMTFVKVREIQMIPVANASAELSGPISWEDLAKRRWAINPSPASADQALLDWLGRRGIQLQQVPVYCRSPYLLSILSEADDIVELCPEPLYRKQLHAHGMQAIGVPDLPPPMQMGVVYLTHKPRSEPVQWLIDAAIRMAGRF
ncbi:LysR family transcriptional regulator [Leisingera methylohalidivorans]|uniref:LysR family transcriptional regulator n=1 Tax=Leisingera methylohalidivorans DSM 14336 TaxID=999552 RepID=V9VWG2_9RHOB|nr:LysR family transcriptional regulator [Leisingera methylohalidivorans]AHD02044.1 LysR family transcriptional regulator [Leisingera methylohalidivorans DSM 14336]